MASVQPFKGVRHGFEFHPPSKARPRQRSESRCLSGRCSDKAKSRELEHRSSIPYEDASIRIFSRSEDMWVDGEVVKVDGEFLRVEYKIGNDLYGKTVHVDSEHIEMRTSTDLEEIDPQGMPNGDVAHHGLRALLSNVRVEFSDGRFGTVEELLDLEFLGNNSVVTKEPLFADCTIELQAPKEDILLRVYALDPIHPKEDFDRYALQGYVHAMQKVRKQINVKTKHFVGLTMQKDLNKNWIWKMTENEREKWITRSTPGTPGGHQDRDDPIAEVAARDADYLISFTNPDKSSNDDLLRNFNNNPVKGPHGNRCIKFCTDRSLGLGGHFISEDGHHEDGNSEYKLDLYLGKHGFMQSTEPGAWKKQYQKASCDTKHGVLLLKLSRAYLKSAACRWEFGHIDRSKIHTFVSSEKRILPFDDLKEEPALCLEVLDDHNQGQGTLDPALLAEDIAWMMNGPSSKYNNPFCELPMLEMCLALVTASKGQDHPKTAKVLSRLSWIYECVGEAEKSRVAAERSSSIKEAIARDHNTKMQMLEQELLTKEAHYGSNHVEVATTLHNLALAHHDLGNHKTVKQMLEQALAIREAHYGSNHEEVATTLVDLAVAHGYLGDHITRKQMLEQALAIKEAHYGSNHGEVAMVLENLANAHGWLGDHITKKQMIEQALPIYEAYYGPNHVLVVNAMQNLARTYGELGDEKSEDLIMEQLPPSGLPRISSQTRSVVQSCIQS